MDELRGRRNLALLVRERWFLGECRGEAVCLYVQLDDASWVEIAPDRKEGCWKPSDSDTKRAHEAFGDGESHYPVRDAGAAYKLNGQMITAIDQKRLDERIEICLQFANATEITMHYNFTTDESSLYFTHDRTIR